MPIVVEPRDYGVYVVFEPVGEGVAVDFEEIPKLIEDLQEVMKK